VTRNPTARRLAGRAKDLVRGSARTTSRVDLPGGEPAFLARRIPAVAARLGLDAVRGR
jgi:hypothetical protein